LAKSNFQRRNPLQRTDNNNRELPRPTLVLETDRGKSREQETVQRATADVDKHGSKNSISGFKVLPTTLNKGYLQNTRYYIKLNQHQ
jgi:hypothetical protein